MSTSHPSCIHILPPLVPPSNGVWSELRPAPPFPPMRVLEMYSHGLVVSCVKWPLSTIKTSGKAQPRRRRGVPQVYSCEEIHEMKTGSWVKTPHECQVFHLTWFPVGNPGISTPFLDEYPILWKLFFLLVLLLYFITLASLSLSQNLNPPTH
jgi:hypothetical protein